MNTATSPIEHNFSYQQRYIREVAFVVEEENNPSFTNDLLDSFRLFFITQFLKRKIKNTKKTIDFYVSEFDSYIVDTKKEQLIIEYNSVKKILDDSQLFEENKIQFSKWYFRSLMKLFNKFIGSVKNLEMKYRIAAYPERNEVHLTYDELKELSEALSGWKCVEEDKINSH